MNIYSNLNSLCYLIKKWIYFSFTIIFFWGSANSANILVEFKNDYDNQLMVEFQPFLDNHHVQSMKKWIPFASPQDRTDRINFFHVYRIKTDYSSKLDINQLIIDLLEFEYIIKVEIEPIHSLHYIPNDSSYIHQWYLDQINYEEALDQWDIPNGLIPNSENILLAVIDTGIDWQHPDLGSHIWQNLNEDADGDGRTIEWSNGSWIFDPQDLDNIDGDDWDDDPNTFIDDLIGWDMAGISGISGDLNPMPLLNVNSQSSWNHGTHISGILSAVTDNITGIASSSYNAKVMMVKIARDDSGEDNIELSNGYSGILYAAKTGYNSGLTTIINISWGTPSNSDFEQELIQLVWEDYNAIIVSSAGNGLQGIESYNQSFPASFENVISVTALGEGDIWNHWGSYHPTVDISAPGEMILSTIINNSYAAGTGSSLASPIVAGSLALLKAFRHEYQREHLLCMLIQTADKNIYNINNELNLFGNLGLGRLDIYSAIATPLFPLITVEIEHIGLINDANNLLNAGDSFNVSFKLSNDLNWGKAENIFLNFESEVSEIIISTNGIEIDSINPGDFKISELEDVYVQIPDNLESGEYQFFLSLISNEGANISTYDNFYSYYLNILPNIIYGDLDTDGLVDIRDLILTREIIIGNLSQNNYPLYLVNLNFDNTVNIIDIALLLNLILD